MGRRGTCLLHPAIEPPLTYCVRHVVCEGEGQPAPRLPSDDGAIRAEEGEERRRERLGSVWGASWERLGRLTAQLGRVPS